MDKISEILNIEESYKAPETLLTILYDKEKREQIFMKFLEAFNGDVSYDWFHEYFQAEHADRKEKKQDFTPNCASKLITKLVESNTGHNTCDICAGTGGITIVKWWNDCTNKFISEYNPSDYIYTCEELSERAIPFLLFNLLIRGMNAVVINCDVLSRTCYGIFLIQNIENDFMKFSSLNLFPYNEDVGKYFNVKFAEKRYKPIIEQNQDELNEILERLHK